MKRSPFNITLVVIAAITLLSPFIDSVRSFGGYMENLAFSTLFIALLLLLPGIALSIAQGSRRVGQAMLLSSAVLLLTSFTLCSTGFFNLNIH